MIMNSKPISIVVITCLLTTVQFSRASAEDKVEGLQKDVSLQVYLPREVTIKDSNFTLGQVSIMRGAEALVTMASEIALGRISVPGQRIAVDRSAVLSRLACNGIPASKVTLTGAEKVTVKRQQQIIKGNKFVELASAFLKENPSTGSVCQLTPVRIPTDLVVSGTNSDIKLSRRLVGRAAGNRAKVQTVVLVDGKQIGTREVTFLLKYSCRRVVALVDIPKGAAISPANVKVEETVSNYREPADWCLPYGLIARRRIAANSVIHSHMVGPVKPQVLLKRNQRVVIRIERSGLLVTAIGKAIQDGRAGEHIKVRNVDSKRIILARVNEDGTVEPVF
jgi:flagella basal body P-ring formation protein FlgA